MVISIVDVLMATAQFLNLIGQCRRCNEDVYILLIISFELTGVAMIMCLILFFSLTVSVGTISGLIFFANLVKFFSLYSQWNRLLFSASSFQG